MRACVPSSTNWLPLKKLEAPLNRFERPLKNWAWPRPTRRAATARESGKSGLMAMHVWSWCHIRNDWTDEVVFARNTKHFRRGDDGPSVRALLVPLRIPPTPAPPVARSVGLTHWIYVHSLHLSIHPSIPSPLASQHRTLLSQTASSKQASSPPLLHSWSSASVAMAPLNAVSDPSGLSDLSRERKVKLLQLFTVCTL